MGRYAIAVVGLAMGGILLFASIENCGWVLGAKPALYCGESAVALVVQVLGAGVSVGAVGALFLTWLGADAVCRGWYERAVGRLSVRKNRDSGGSRRDVS